MPLPTKLPICPFRNSARARKAEGMVLIIVMMVAALLLVALTVTLPSVYQEGQREREAELIFRGTQYARAVGLFHRQFNRYPVNIKELMGTNGMRFLRQEYSDPMDRKGKWRFIHANAAGVLIDSKNQPLTTNQPNPAGLGAQSSFSGQPPSPGQTSPAGGMSLGGSASSFGGPGQSSFSSSDQSSFGNSNQSSFGGSGQNPLGLGTSQPGSQSTSTFFGSSSGVQGAFIVGVAATTHHESIRIWQKHQHYDEWEFIGTDQGIFGVQVGMPGFSSGQTGLGQQPTQQGFGSSQGNMNPLSTPPSSTPPSN